MCLNSSSTRGRYASEKKQELSDDDAFKAQQQKEQNLHHELQNAKQNLHQGTLYASISLILLISSFSMIMPYLQSKRDELQCDILCQGSLTSARSTLSLLGSALMGRLSDSKRNNNDTRLCNSRILCLYIGTLASLAGFIIDASFNSIRGMWIAMIPGALLQQNFSIYKALLADYHEDISKLEHGIDKLDQEKKKIQKQEKTNAITRAGSVGQLGMSVGIAFILGPIVGALLVKTYQGAIIVAICLTLLSSIGIMKMPTPTSMASAKTTCTKENNKAIATNNCINVLYNVKQKIMNVINVKAAKSKPAIFLIVIRLSMALAFHIFNTIWTASLKRRFNFGPSDHGKFMSFIGLVYALSQGFIAKRILSFFDTKEGSSSGSGRVKVILFCCLSLGVGRVVAFQVNDIKIVYLMFAFIVTSLGVVNTILTADTCLIAPSSEIGGVYGILEAAQSAAGMIGPFLGGILAKIDPVIAPLASVVGLYLLVFILVLFGYDKLILQQSKNNETSTIAVDSKKNV